MVAHGRLREGERCGEVAHARLTAGLGLDEAEEAKTRRVGEDTAWLARARDMGIPHRFVEGAFIRRRVREGNLSADLAAGREAIVRVLRESVARRRATPGARGG